MEGSDAPLKSLTDKFSRSVQVGRRRQRGARVQPCLLGCKRQHSETSDRPDKLAVRLRLDGTYPGDDGQTAYHVQHVPAGFSLMLLAGTLSGLLGIGSGALKVLAMDRAMRVPFKVSTTTSNFMIGVTAAASAGVYLNRGYIDPGLTMPVMLGVLTGSLLGTRVLVRSVPLTIEYAFEGHGRGIMQLGLLLLIATPIARVVMSAFAFSRQRDWMYVAVSLIVLTFLTISLLGLAT